MHEAIHVNPLEKGCLKENVFSMIVNYLSLIKDADIVCNFLNVVININYSKGTV